MTNITNEQLEALLNEATPGPWVAKGRYIGTPSHMSYVAEVRDQNGNWSDTAKSRRDAALIAAAPALAAALLAERKAREVEVGELRAALKPFVDATVNADLKRLEHDDLFIRLTWPSRKGHTYFADMLPQRFIDARQALKGPTP